MRWWLRLVIAEVGDLKFGGCGLPSNRMVDSEANWVAFEAVRLAVRLLLTAWLMVANEPWF